MTENDWRLLQLAHDTKAVDNQDVYKMINLADTKEAKQLLQCQYNYLYAKEEELAGYL